MLEISSLIISVYNQGKSKEFLKKVGFFSHEAETQKHVETQKDRNTSLLKHRIGRYSRSLTQASICPRFYKRFVINHAILASTTGTLHLPKPDKNFRLY
jgi:hypothetical protein